MSGEPSAAIGASYAASSSGWTELWRKEDWWAVWLGLAVVLAAYVLFVNGSSIAWLAVAPPKWAALPQLVGHFEANAARYLVQFILLLGLFTFAASLIGYPVRHFIPGFLLVYLLSILVFAASAWEKALSYNIEPPLIALAGGLAIGNLNGLPRWLDAGFRVEFYIKTGIVLLGATLPFSLIVWAGPVAILQASIVSVVTFLVIFYVGRRLGLDRRLAAVLGAGGAVCGVSAAIAIAGAVRAKREYPPIAITLVVLWAIVMIFALPLVSRALALPAGVGGAWIGTSEFADAAGFAAAQTYGGFATAGAISGTADQALWSYTLLKVVGRDVWIGIWALVLSVIAVTKWEVAETGGHAGVGEIWWRFPKFVLGFLLASLLVTFAVRNATFADYNAVVRPGLVLPITTLRTWAFTFSFLSIGLTTRLRDFAPAGGKPFLAFTAGVVVNVVLGFVLSVLVFGSYWGEFGTLTIAGIFAVWRAAVTTPPPPGRCGACGHFANDGASVEAAFPGLAAMGSGFASVRANDGVCKLRDIYLPIAPGAGGSTGDGRITNSDP